MKIETSYEVGQNVFFLEGTKLIEHEIHSIDISIYKEIVKETICFRLESPVGIVKFEIKEPVEVFASKQVFLDQLDSKMTYEKTVEILCSDKSNPISPVALNKMGDFVQEMEDKK